VADVRDAVAKVRSFAPHPGARSQRVDVDGNEIVAYAVKLQRPLGRGASWFVTTRSASACSPWQCVAVSRGAAFNREIRVELDPARMQALRRHRGASQPATAP